MIAEALVAITLALPQAPKPQPVNATQPATEMIAEESSRNGQFNWESSSSSYGQSLRLQEEQSPSQPYQDRALGSTGSGSQAQGKASQHLRLADWSLIAADASVRALDVYSTHRMLDRGYHELILPKAIANHTPAMAAYSGACVVGNVLAARYLVKRGHPKMAKFLLSVDVAQDGVFAVRNLTLRKLKAGEVVR